MSPLLRISVIAETKNMSNSEKERLYDLLCLLEDSLGSSIGDKVYMSGQASQDLIVELGSCCTSIEVLD